MIPRTTLPCQAEDTKAQTTQCPSTVWQTALAQAIRDPAELLHFLNLPASLLQGAIAANRTFPLRVPRSYCQRIEKGNPDDPLLKQVLPLGLELEKAEEFTIDPVGDLAAVEVAGLLHKYHGRVLIITTAACAVHCRYCFRRHFPYQDNQNHHDWQNIVSYIQTKPEIHEVILSGGDPLSLTESRLKNLTDKLQDIPHIKTLRIHTRLPIVLPERINSEFLKWIDSLPWKIVMVLHCNHANEIDDSVATALKQLQQHNITLLNQSVLLAGVNDSADILTSLSHKLFAHHVLPYYLHQLDKVEGAKHFYTSTSSALQLIKQMQHRLPGYLVPKLVVEEAGKQCKTAIT